tara:strand:+ start:10922 stop:11308 length:387 start_codon:yes stop_codon:yes gene_type:complete
MSDALRNIGENLLKPSNWIRLGLVAGFVFLLYVVLIPLVIIVIFTQFLFSVIANEPNINLKELCVRVFLYIQEILNYVTYISDAKPFPFNPFPNAQPAFTQDQNEAFSKMENYAEDKGSSDHEGSESS